MCRFGLDMGIRENSERSFVVPLALIFDQNACDVSLKRKYFLPTKFYIHN